MTKFWTGPYLKPIEDDKLNFAKMVISAFDRVENVVGKEEDAGYQHFVLFFLCFKTLLPNGP